MTATVVDASAVAAVLFDEPAAEPILATISGRLLAPSLLLYELARVCTIKLARRPADMRETLDRYALLERLAIDLTEPEWSALPQLAVDWGLSAYDAAYLQIALRERALLVTLDARLAAAYGKASA